MMKVAAQMHHVEPSHCHINGKMDCMYSIPLHGHHIPCRGFIHHIKAISSDSQLNADEIFREYQDQALAGVLPFRRWPLRSVNLSRFDYCFFLSLTNRARSTNVGIDLDLFLFPVIPHTISPPGRGSLLTNYFSQNSTFNTMSIQ